MKINLIAWVAAATLACVSCGKTDNPAADKKDAAAGGTGYSVTATVSGLTGSSLVLTLDATTDISVSANGSATVANNLATGTTYAVTVKTQPVNPNQICAIANGSGTIASANVTNITVTCVAASWQQEAYVKTSNADENDYVGMAMAIDGDLMAIGAYGESANQNFVTNGSTASADNSLTYSGAVYVFRRTAGTWVQEAYLKPSNVDGGDYFGTRVAISNSIIAVAAPYEQSNQTTISHGNSASSNNSLTYAGAVYIFQRNGENWEQSAYIKASNTRDYIGFGSDLAISGDTLIVTAAGDSSNQTTITNGSSSSTDVSSSYSGAVFVYRLNGSVWTQEAYLKSANSDANDYFGYSVSISGDTIAVGAYWEDSSQSTITNGSTASPNNSVSNAGAVFVYRRSGTSWYQEAYIKAPNPDAEDLFGYSVSISGDTILVGAGGEDSAETTITNGQTASADNSAIEAGAAYVFRRNGSTWTQEAFLKASNANAGDGFGWSVSLSGDVAVVGASEEDSAQTTITNGATASSDNSISANGAAYVFRRIGSTWSQEAYLKPPVASANKYFAEFVAMSGDTVLLGCYKDSSNQRGITHGTTASADTSAPNSGAVHVFRLK